MVAPNNFRGLTNSRLIAALVLALALAVLAGTVAAGARRLQRVVRAQMINRDGEILNAVAQAQEFGTSTNLAERLGDSGGQLALALQISQLKEGVMGVRLFDAHRQFVTAFPPTVIESVLRPETSADLQKLGPVSYYNPTARLADYILTDPAAAAAATNPVPILEVNIPIHAPGQTQLLASAQLIMDAHDLALEALAFDRQLFGQALGVFLAGAALLSAALVWAYRRLQTANELLRERTARLLRANHELTLAAKTGALGAVTAHLVHGLSNPLANLREFIADRGGERSEEDWRDAIAATGRMQQLVHEVVRVLGERSDDSRYEVTLEELRGILDAKIQPLARERGVRCESGNSAANVVFDNHQANTILLILENIISNAIEVTPAGGRVRVTLANFGRDIGWEVADGGPGFPEHCLKNSFTPCRSTKGGAGLGLAISNQLATQLGARLEIKRSGSDGSVVVLTLTAAAFGGRETSTEGAKTD